MSWTWALMGPDESPLEPPAQFANQLTFGAQADAETWVGQTWHELSDAGVAAVTLVHNGDVVYGPMSLRPASE